MRSANAIPPAGHPVRRSMIWKPARRWATALLLFALVLAALPQPMPAVAQPDPAQTPLPATVTDATGIPSDAPVPPDGGVPENDGAIPAPTQPDPDGAPSELGAPATDTPADVPADAPADAPAQEEPPPPAAAPADSDPAEPVRTGTTSTSTTEEILLVTAANATLPAVCQLVIRATALTPPPGTGIGDPLPDPVAGAAFSVTVTGGGSITLLTDSSGVLNLYPALLANAGLGVATGDTVTVTQVGTRAGLTLGEPAFAMTFAWQSASSADCRVEAFVVNPVAAASPVATASPGDTGPASPSASPGIAASTNPSPSPSPSASPSPSPSPIPTATPPPTQPPVTATSVPTATAMPEIPSGFGQIEVTVVARPSAGASPGAPQVRLAGARFIIVNRTGRVLTATITTGSDGSARSPLLAIGSYDLILDNPPVGYFGAQAHGFDVTSPTLQHVVFQLEANTAPTPSPSAPASAVPGTATATVRSSSTPPGSPTARATSTTRAATVTATVRAATATSTVRAATATSKVPTPTATAPSTGTAAPAPATQRPARATSTPGGTAGAGPATTTPRPATATTRPTTATAPATATQRPTTAAATATRAATVRPATIAATAPSVSPTVPRVTGTPSRPTRVPATGPAATATRTPTPRPAGTAGRPTRVPATVPGTPTRVTQIQDASITVYVSICIDPRFIDFGEFGSETDLGPRYLTDIDRSRCRPARSGETRITLTSTYPRYLPAYARTNSTDANGRVSFVFPATREQRIGNLHLEGPIPATDAGVKIDSGRALVIPLTIVILDPAIGATGAGATAAGAPPVSGGDTGWLPGTLAIIGLPLALAAARRFGTRGR